MSDQLNLDEIKARADGAETRIYLAAQSVYAEDPYEIALGIIKPMAADVLALLAQLDTARVLLMDCWHQLDGDVYVLPGGEVHPGALTTIHALHAFLWPEGKTI